MEIAPTRGYAICTEPRSGSNLLCRILESTGQLGRGREYFAAPTVRARGHVDYPDDPEAQLSAFLPLSTTPNGVYAIKLFSRHFDQVRHTRWAARLPGLHFVHLEQHDLLGQAISYVRAHQTNAWTSEHKRGEATYDAAAIDERLVLLVRAKARWRYWFESNGLTVLRVYYEDVVTFPQAVTEQVGRLLGLEETPIVDPALVNVRIQRDDLTELWRERFVAEHRDLGAFN